MGPAGSVRWTTIVYCVIVTLFGYCGVRSEPSLKKVFVTTNSPVRKGENALIDCRVTDNGTSIKSIQWYKLGEKQPVYSFVYDGVLRARGSLQGRAVQKTIDRGFYRLIIGNIQLTDEATYQCHVFQSFVIHQMNSSKLTVTAIPSTPVITGPNSTVPSNGSISLLCEGNVGKPAGRLRWWRRLAKNREFEELLGTELDRSHNPDRTTTVLSKYSKTVVNPEDYQAVYKCTAENEALQPNEPTPEATFGKFPSITKPKESKDDKEEGFHVAGIFVLSMAGVGLVALIVICVRRHKKLQPCRCTCGGNKEKDPMVSTIQGSQVRVTFRGQNTEFDAEDRV